MPQFVGHGLLLNRQFSGKNGRFVWFRLLHASLSLQTFFLRKNSHEQKFFSTNKNPAEKSEFQVFKSDTFISGAFTFSALLSKIRTVCFLLQK